VNQAKVRKLPKELKPLYAAAVKQGWDIKETNKGFQLRPPGGAKIVCLHMTPSDHRTYLNTRAQMRQSGLVC
jgi:hypothetical protein